jgi:peroxiredoxin
MKAWLAIGALLMLTSFTWTQHGGEQATVGVGQKVDNVKLMGLDGKHSTLHDFKGKKAVVVVFLTFDCPICTSYLAGLSEFAQSHKETVFLGVCPSADEPGMLARQVEDYAVGFPVFQDAALKVAGAFGATVTPEVFVFDDRFTLRYRGRIDDAWVARLKENRETTHHDLRQALDEVLAGKTVSRPRTATVGCSIVRGETRPVSTTFTYYKDVLPILQKRCQGCHRPGEMGPFSLMTHAQAVNWAADIKEYTRSRRMPPWKVTDGVPFHGERKLTDQEIATLAAWADGGTPAGNLSDAPPPARFADGWMLGQPDLILSPKESFTLGPTGPDAFRVFVLPTGLTEDKFVSAYEVRPSNPRAVHHTVHFIDLRGRGRRLEQLEKQRPRRADDKDSGPGYSSIMGPGFFPPDGDLGGWAPGITPHFLPDGVGYYLPKGTDFIAHVHYHRTGKIEKDRIQIGLHFSKNPRCKPLQQMVIGGRFLSIPAGEPSFPVKGTIWVVQDCMLYTIVPHMHLLGKKIKITMTPPGQPTRTLIGIGDWDFNWQEFYIFKEPIKVKAETRFDVEAVFDNSASNPNNPSSPPRRVLVGETTTNEMCFGFLGATIDEPGPLGFRLWKGGLTVRRLGVLPGGHSTKMELGAPP